MKKCRAFNRAVNHLRRIVSDSGPHIKLPPVRQLASDARVSLVTMVKACKHLRAINELPFPTVKPSNPRSSAHETDSPKKNRWTIIRDMIMQDIISGSFRHAALLPSPKEMRVRYGGNYRTIKKATDDLKSVGVIAVHGRGHRLAQRERNAGHTELLVFLYCETEELYLSYLDPHLLRLLETMCHTARITLTFIRYCETGGTVRCINHTTGKEWNEGQCANALGCIWIILFPWDILPDLCRKLHRMKKPIAVSDNPNVNQYPQDFRDNPLVKYFTHRDLSRFGADVGQYLLGLGHRRIAFFCTQMERAWARARLDGLRTVYALAGFPSAVTSYSVESTTLRANIRINQAMEPLCRQAHRAKGDTAWVCSDDYEALCALDFLKHKKAAVPEKLSVVGFNNSLPALTANLTSYDHNSEAIMAAMLNYIVRPHSLGAFQRRKIIDFEGFVVSRGSAGRVPAG